MLKRFVKYGIVCMMVMVMTMSSLILAFADIPDGFTGTSTVNGVVYYYYNGELMDSKEAYLNKWASRYTSPDSYGSIELSGGERYWLYMGNVYNSEEAVKNAYYNQNGYISEAEALSMINSWYDKNANTISFFVKYQGTSAAFDSFFAKLNSIGNSGYYTYREHIMTSMSYTTRTGTDTYEIKMDIEAAQHGTQAEIETGKAEAKKVAATLKGKSTYEQIKGAYEWLCNNIEYDHNSADNNLIIGHSLYSAMVTRKTVCEGYASAFQIMMDELGIECYIVKGNVDGDHAWNVVKIDGIWYQVDATWADQGTWISYDYLLMGTNLRGNVTTLPLSATAYSNGQPSGGQNPTQSTQPPATNDNTTAATTTATTTEPVTAPTTSSTAQDETTTNEKNTSEDETTTDETTKVEETTKDDDVKKDSTSVKHNEDEESTTSNEKDSTSYNEEDTKSDEKNQENDSGNGVYLIVAIVGVIVVVGIAATVVVLKKKNDCM